MRSAGGRGLVGGRAARPRAGSERADPARAGTLIGHVAVYDERSGALSAATAFRARYTSDSTGRRSCARPTRTSTTTSRPRRSSSHLRRASRTAVDGLRRGNRGGGVDRRDPRLRRDVDRPRDVPDEALTLEGAIACVNQRLDSRWPDEIAPSSVQHPRTRRAAVARGAARRRWASTAAWSTVPRHGYHAHPHRADPRVPNLVHVLVQTDEELTGPGRRSSSPTRSRHTSTTLSPTTCSARTRRRSSATRARCAVASVPGPAGAEVWAASATDIALGTCSVRRSDSRCTTARGPLARAVP